MYIISLNVKIFKLIYKIYLKCFYCLSHSASQQANIVLKKKFNSHKTGDINSHFLCRVCASVPYGSQVGREVTGHRGDGAEDDPPQEHMGRPGCDEMRCDGQ